MSTSSDRPGAFVSVFEREFDVIVYGAGFVGYAAACSLASRGLSTLLLEPSGDLLWEATRALVNTTAVTDTDAGGEWRAWLGKSLGGRASAAPAFDPALLEIAASRELTSGKDGLPAMLLYAPAVSVERSGNAVASAIVATKGGPRRVSGLRWLDASEQGDLIRMAGANRSLRWPTRIERRMLVHTGEAAALDATLRQLAEKKPGVTWSPSVRPEERIIGWTTEPDGQPWYRVATGLAAEMRTIAGPEIVFGVSLCGMRDFPVYEGGGGANVRGLPANLLAASPALRDEVLTTPGDRFGLGRKLAETCAALPAAEVRSAGAGEPVRLPPCVRDQEACDVLVAGVGTGGSHAAIAAARSGAKTRAFDFTGWPGGVGTGGGICGYFHGAKGGLQSEVDERVKRVEALLCGAVRAAGWHHEAKKIALLELFEEAGVRFLGDVMLVGTEQDGSGRVLAAVAVVGGELVRIPAKAFIDGTGDADLAAFAGAASKEGRIGDGRTLSYSQSVFSFTTKNGQPAVHSCNFDAGWVDPADVEDLTRARLTGTAQHFETLASVEGSVFAVSPWIGLRQSRHIETDYLVTMADLVGSARFDDSIGVTETVADTHSVDFEFESDELAFYYWTCRGFRHVMRCELPYRMMLPRGLSNVWVACRAAGIAVDAAYGLRMQRDLQRMGEAAGIAAAAAAANGVGAREVNLRQLQAALTASGAKSSAPEAESGLQADALLAALDQGLPGVAFWHLFQNAHRFGEAIRARLSHDNPRVTFYAAAILAMAGDASAEPRLIEALVSREQGPAPEEKPVPGAFAQCIDLPFWMQAVVLLRRVGTAACLSTLEALASTPGQPLNVRTTIALTLERLVERLGPRAEIRAAAAALEQTELPDPVLPPSRSLWRTLNGQPQKKLANDRGAKVAQDHTWQLQLVLVRIRRHAGWAGDRNDARFLSKDHRGIVRRALHATSA